MQWGCRHGACRTDAASGDALPSGHVQLSVCECVCERGAERCGGRARRAHAARAAFVPSWISLQGCEASGERGLLRVRCAEWCRFLAAAAEPQDKERRTDSGVLRENMCPRGKSCNSYPANIHHVAPPAPLSRCTPASLGPAPRIPRTQLTADRGPPATVPNQKTRHIIHQTPPHLLGARATRPCECGLLMSTGSTPR